MTELKKGDLLRVVLVRDGQESRLFDVLIQDDDEGDFALLGTRALTLDAPEIASAMLMLVKAADQFFEDLESDLGEPHGQA